MNFHKSLALVGCPVCGRRLRVRSVYVGQEVCCGHCHGRMVISETEEKTVEATSLSGKNLMERVEQLLCKKCKTDSHSSDRSCQQPSDSDEPVGPSKTLNSLLLENKSPEYPPATHLLASQHDGVFTGFFQTSLGSETLLHLA